MRYRRMRKSVDAKGGLTDQGLRNSLMKCHLDILLLEVTRVYQPGSSAVPRHRPLCCEQQRITVLTGTVGLLILRHRHRRLHFSRFAVLSLNLPIASLAKDTIVSPLPRTYL
jgi:hypothetical protein